LLNGGFVIDIYGFRSLGHRAPPAGNKWYVSFRIIWGPVVSMLLCR